MAFSLILVYILSQLFSSLGPDDVSNFRCYAMLASASLQMKSKFNVALLICIQFTYTGTHSF